MLFLLSFFIIGNKSLAQENEENKGTTFIPQITIPGSIFQKGSEVEIKDNTRPIGEYILSIYNYLLAVVGLLAAIVLMISGVIWLTAAGNSDKISQAKNWMIGSLTGLVLMLTSYIILKTVNPGLIEFKNPEISKIEALKFCSPVKGPIGSDKTYACTKKEDGPKEIDSLICGKSESGTQSKCLRHQSIECYDYELGKYVTGYSCIIPEDYICCEYENSFWYGRPCVTISSEENCPQEYSGNGNQKLKKTYPNQCNIQEGEGKEKPCYY